eukprot:6195196-Amphidinium_carterae.1
MYPHTLQSIQKKSSPVLQPGASLDSCHRFHSFAGQSKDVIQGEFLGAIPVLTLQSWYYSANRNYYSI